MSVATRRILGISDSGSVFAPQWQAPLYMQLIADLSGVAKPTVCYVGAASGDDPRRISDFADLVSRVGGRSRALRVFAMTSDDPEDFFENADVVFIDGGSTRNLLALLREWGAVDALIDAYRRGVLIAGASAGISMFFDWYITDSVLTRISADRGIGVLSGTVCAHYDAREDRRRVLDRLIGDEKDALPAYGLDEGTSMYFVNEDLNQQYTIKSDTHVHIVRDALGGRKRLAADPILLGESEVRSERLAAGPES